MAVRGGRPGWLPCSLRVLQVSGGAQEREAGEVSVLAPACERAGQLRRGRAGARSCLVVQAVEHVLTQGLAGGGGQEPGSSRGAVRRRPAARRRAAGRLAAGAGH